MDRGSESSLKIIEAHRAAAKANDISLAAYAVAIVVGILGGIALALMMSLAVALFDVDAATMSSPVGSLLATLYVSWPLLLLMVPAAAILFLPGAMLSVMLLRRWKRNSLVAISLAGAANAFASLAILLLAAGIVHRDASALVGALPLALFAALPGALAGLTYGVLSRRFSRRRAGHSQGGI